jgi:hypothetical protein
MRVRSRMDRNLPTLLVPITRRAQPQIHPRVGNLSRICMRISVPYTRAFCICAVQFLVVPHEGSEGNDIARCYPWKAPHGGAFSELSMQFGKSRGRKGRCAKPTPAGSRRRSTAGSQTLLNRVNSVLEHEEDGHEWTDRLQRDDRDDRDQGGEETVLHHVLARVLAQQSYERVHRCSLSCRDAIVCAPNNTQDAGHGPPPPRVCAIRTGISSVCDDGRRPNGASAHAEFGGNLPPGVGPPRENQGSMPSGLASAKAATN